jgi:hypothetical protein
MRQIRFWASPSLGLAPVLFHDGALLTISMMILANDRTVTMMLFDSRAGVVGVTAIAVDPCPAWTDIDVLCKCTHRSDGKGGRGSQSGNRNFHLCLLNPILHPEMHWLPKPFQDNPIMVSTPNYAMVLASTS